MHFNTKNLSNEKLIEDGFVINYDEKNKHITIECMFLWFGCSIRAQFIEDTFKTKCYWEKSSRWIIGRTTTRTFIISRTTSTKTTSKLSNWRSNWTKYVFIANKTGSLTHSLTYTQSSRKPHDFYCLHWNTMRQWALTL